MRGELRRSPLRPGRTRYRFVERYTTVDGVQMLVWQRPFDGSRVEQITCPADTFWGTR